MLSRMVSAERIAALQAHTRVLEVELVVPLERRARTMARDARERKRARRLATTRRACEEQLLQRVVLEVEQELQHATNDCETLADDVGSALCAMMDVCDEIKRHEDTEAEDVRILLELLAQIPQLEASVEREKNEVDLIRQTSSARPHR